jgi:DNA-binding CsgD family transcriptional regulator
MEHGPDRLDVLSDADRAALAGLLERELAAAWNRAVTAGARGRDLAALVANRLERVHDLASAWPESAGSLADRISVRSYMSAETPLGLPGAGKDFAMTANAFIGRTAELDRLGLLLEAARDRRPTAVVLTGEPGVGKTRLLEQFALRAARADALVLRGECFELGDGLPYAPLVSALRLLHREHGDVRTRELAGPAWEQLAELISDFTGREPAARRPSVLGGQMQVYGTVMRVLRHIGNRLPVVLVFENLHWTDLSTLRLVSYLVHEMRDDRTLLICSSRGELPQNHAFRRLLVEPDFVRRVEQMILREFSESEMRIFFRALGESDRQKVRRGYRLSEGNAFFAEQLVRAGTLEDPDAVQVPQLLQQIMLSRINDLSRNAARLLSIAATASRRVSYLLLATVSGLDEDALDDALRECLDQDMLVADETNDAFVFRHALLREAAYKRELKHNQTKWHTAMAEAITANTDLSLDEDQDAAIELAHHWYRANRRPEALVSALRAGAMTARIRAFDEADVQYRRALELWTEVPDPERLTRAAHEEVLVDAADAARWSGLGPRAVELITAAIDEVDAQARPRRAGELRERLGSYLWEAGKMPESAEAYRQAWRLLAREPVDDALDARVLAGLAMAEIRADRYTEAVSRALEADNVAERAGAAAERGRAKNTAGLAYTLLGDAPKGIELLREALELARQSRHLEIFFRVYANLGAALVRVGDLAAAASVAREGLEQARSQGLGQARQTGVLANNAAVALLLLGRLAEAAELLEDVLADDPPLQESLYLRLTYAEVELARGHLDVVERLIAQVEAANQTDPHFLAALHACRAELMLWRDGDADAALSAVEQGLALLDGGENSDDYLRLCVVGARAAADLRTRHPGDERAEERSRALAEHTPRFDPEASLPAELEAVLRQCDAERERAFGRDGAEAWADLAAAWSRLGRPYPAAYAGWRRAAASLRAGDSASAAELAAAVLSATRELGAEPLSRELRALILEAGDPAGPAAPSPIRLLSEKQLEVVRRMARDLSDKQIAKEMGLKPGTVARHGYDARHKLAEHGYTRVNTRMGLVNWAREQGLLEEPASTRTTTEGDAP